MGFALPDYTIAQSPNRAIAQSRDHHIHNQGTAPITMALFFDPNPRQLQSAASACDSRPALGMKSRSHAGSGSCWLMVGGRNPRARASAAVTIPAAPLAPCGWPIIDLTDDPARRSAWS